MSQWGRRRFSAAVARCRTLCWKHHRKARPVRANQYQLIAIRTVRGKLDLVRLLLFLAIRQTISPLTLM